MGRVTYASHEIQLSVPFHDLDPLQVVWHGNYLKYFDRARFALFDHCGVDLHAYSRTSGFLFPVTRTSTKHILPLRYRDHFIVRTAVREAHIRIVLDFEIRRLGDDLVTTRGRSEQVSVKYPGDELMLQIPPEIESALTVAPANDDDSL
ncbi:MAG: thioesterase family protein [Desulfobacterales bacterium]